MTWHRPTISDVARLAGVSIKTVSRVFNNEPNVRPTTRARVLAAAERIDYSPNLSARRLASNRALVVGMLYDNPHGDYITEMQYGSIDVCKERGYHLLIHPCKADSPDLVEEVTILHREATVDGLIVLQPVSDLDDFNRALLDLKIPYVRISQRKWKDVPWISVDDEEAAENITGHLLNLGHRRVGFIMGHPDHGSSHDRLQGYRSALAHHGIDYDDSLVEQGFFDYESGYSCARRLLSIRPRPTAIFASNDPMAMGVFTAAYEKGLRIPSQLSVAGFDDTSMARYVWPPLTTVRQPISEIAAIATEVLLDILQDEESGALDRRLHATLVRRGSTAAPPEYPG